MMWTAVGLFLLSASIVAVAGARFARTADVLADATGFGRVWMGAILVAAVTSLPELVTGLVSVTAARAPDLAVGDLLGSCVFNLALLALVDVIHRDGDLYRSLDRTHLVPAGYGLLMFALAGLGMTTPASRGTSVPAALATPVLALLYVVAARDVHQEIAEQRREAEQAARRVVGRDLWRFAGWAAVVIGGGATLPFTASRLAAVMSWEQSFVGGLFLAASTSLPEVAVTLQAVRRGAVDLAVGNLLGSNLFNLLLLGLDDLAWTDGPLLAAVQPRNAVHLLSATAMTAIFAIALSRHRKGRGKRIASFASLWILVLYLLNGMLLYQQVPAP